MFWFTKMLEKIGIAERNDGGTSLYEEIYLARYREVCNRGAATPVYAYLADDPDIMVRRDALNDLGWCVRIRTAESLPTLRRHLQDADPLCRAYAARGVWWGAQDPEILAVVVPLLNDKDARSVAGVTLCEMAGSVPESFPHLAKLYEDRDFKWETLRVMPRFGKRGIPIIRDALRNPHIQLTAVVSARHLGKDGTELIPDLLALRLKDPHPYIDEALSSIDPVRFPQPAK